MLTGGSSLAEPRPRSRPDHSQESTIDATTTPEGRDGWRLMAEQVRKQRRGIALGVLVGVIWTAAKVSVPFLVKLAIDRGIEGGDDSALLWWAVAIGVVGLISATFTGLRRYVAFREARWAEADLRDRLFAHLQRLHFAFHDRTATGQLMSRGNTDLQQFQNFLVMIPISISNAVAVLAVTVILFSIDAVLAALALCSLPFVNVLGKRFSSRLHPAVMGIQQESAEVAEVVEETVSGVRVVKGFGAEPIQARRLHTEADDLYEVSMDAARVRANYLPALELLPNLGLIAVLGYGGHLVLDGGLSLGSLVAFNAYVVMLIWPLRMLGMIVAQAQRAAAAGERVYEVLATEPVIVDHPDGVPLPAGGGALRFEGVRFTYPAVSGRATGPVLDGLTLTVATGESVALVGPTGSGKSTVAKPIPRFYDVDDGRVLIDGVDVRDARLRDVRRAVGIVF
ncbi:hypothetical protein BH24ACT3_BH24ACT3_07770 [soil metagenome]